MMDEFYNFAFCYAPDETFSHNAIVVLKDRLENVHLKLIKE